MQYPEIDLRGKECKSETLCVDQTLSPSLEIIIAFVLLSGLLRATVLKAQRGSRPQCFLPVGPFSSLPVSLPSPLSTLGEACCRQPPPQLFLSA